jgi:hypothetical protein
MNSAKYNMICPQGSTFVKELTWKIEDTPVNLSGYSARMQVREKYSTPYTTIDLNSEEDGGISLGEESGTILIYINSEITESTFAKEYVYDLKIIDPSGDVFRIIEGKFIVTPEVTR